MLSNQRGTNVPVFLSLVLCVSVLLYFIQTTYRIRSEADELAKEIAKLHATYGDSLKEKEALITESQAKVTALEAEKAQLASDKSKAESDKQGIQAQLDAAKKASEDAAKLVEAEKAKLAAVVEYLKTNKPAEVDIKDADPPATQLKVIIDYYVEQMKKIKPAEPQATVAPAKA